MNNKPMSDLPRSSRRPPAVPEVRGEVVDLPPEGLAPAEPNPMDRAKAQAVTDAIAIARTLVEGYLEIRRIREQSAADVARIEAETRRIEQEMVGEVSRMTEHRRGVEAKGKVVVEVIDAISRQLGVLSEADREARGSVVANLPRLVEIALSSK